MCMGDPETEVIFRIQTDIIDLFIAMDNGTIDQIKVDVNPQTAATVMAVSGGYPDSYEKGKGLMDCVILNRLLFIMLVPNFKTR